jgi:serine/threonine-protein kinase
MQLEPGTTLGHYEILSSIGAGGMGEVYRARDTKLGREVAVKLLLDEVSTDPERLARFEREARVLASLNHSNVATLHGFEKEGDTSFLVMELVEGDTLADRIARGAIPVEEALPLFLQIAEGLEAAHEKGVIHRDLKPANIKASDGGNVKILDFGLAKAMAPEVDAGDPAMSMSPTLTLAATQHGEILGTAAYMSPEQAKGKTVDKRTDVWAFGCCLYEALTGRPAFKGEDAPEVLAAVLKEDPALDAVDPRLRSLLGRCLAKSSNQRYHAMGDLRLDLTDAASRTPAIDAPGKRTSFALLGWVVAAIVASALLFVVATGTTDELTDGRVTRTHVEVPGMDIHEIYGFDVAPDGGSVVYVRREGGSSSLVRRGLSEIGTAPVPGTEDFIAVPFFSADGDWLIFMGADGELVKTPAAGGRPVGLQTTAKIYGGGDSAPDGRIFVKVIGEAILRSLPEAGGPGVPLTFLRDGELLHRNPHVLPAGDAIVFTVRGEAGRSSLAAMHLDEKEHEVVLRDGSLPFFVPSGHLVFHRPGGLWAVGFDPERLEATGEPFALPDAPFEGYAGMPVFSVSQSGVLVYLSRDRAADRTLVWLGRDGREQPLDLAPGAYFTPRVSPDGARISFATIDGLGGHGRRARSDLLVYQEGLSDPSRVDSAALNSLYPLWTPSGEGLVFLSYTLDGWSLWLLEEGETRPVSPYLADFAYGYDWLPDGRLLFEVADSFSSTTFVLVDPDTRESQEVQIGERQAASPSLSPGGRWIVYDDLETSGRGIWVAPFPDVHSREHRRIAQGARPLWSPDGREIFFLRGGALLSLSVRIGSTSVDPLGDPVEIVSGPYFDEALYVRPYDYDAINDRFVAVRHGTAPTSLVVVQGLEHELRRLSARE